MAAEQVESDEIRRFEEQYRSNPDSLVFARLADAHRKAGDPNRALSILREGIRRHPDYPSAHIVRARCLIDVAQPAEAEASLRRAIELDGQNLVAMRGLASLAEKRSDPVEAVHWFEQISVLDPMNAEAEVALERLRGSLPKTPPGLEPLPAPREEWWSSPAFQIADEVREAGEPEDFAEEAGEVEPAAAADPASGDETGAAELPGGTPSGRAWWFEDPGEDEPAEDGDLLTRTMAELYVKQGLTDEAAAIYRELLRDRPDDTQIRRALEELERGDAEGTELAGTPEATAPEPAKRELAPLPPAEPVEAGPATDTPEPEGASPAAGAPERTAAPAGRGPVSVDPYASHPVPATAGESGEFRDWLRRLEE